jgi:5-methylthioadenosine/S-adenosylhomocysteine deaminase
VLPGLVNAHTHLELTGLSAALGAPDFPSWIRQLRTLKAERTAEQFLDAARQGLRECWAGGVTTVADTGDTGSVARALFELGGRGIAYQEVFGPDPAQCRESMAGLERAMALLAPLASDHLTLGVSPHAPYTVSGVLYREVTRWARERRLPLALHLAESAEESALLRGEGGFAEAWGRRGIAVPAPAGLTPVGFVDHWGVLGPDMLCIHAVRVNDEDIRIMAARGAAVAHCPLSNLAHAHGTAPLVALRRAGLRIGIGTDSVLSVGTLDLRAEARRARTAAGLNAEEALRLVTVDAARALGLSGVGAIEAGGWGDLCVMRAHGTDPVEAILAPATEVMATFVAGRPVYREMQAS